MSRTLRIRPTGAAAVVSALIGAAVLAGCSAGQITQTSRQVAGVGGANVTVGSVAIRDAQIEFGDGVEGGNVYSSGDSAPLRMSIVNIGADADRLVSATSPAASSVQVSGDPEIPGGQVLVVEGEPPPPAAAPAAPATARPGAGPTPTGTPIPTTPVPPTAAADGEREAQIVLAGLREDVRAGLTYPVVLTFARAGEIRLDVPVGNPSAPRVDEPAE